MKKPKPAKIMAPAHPFTASGAQTTTVWMKPAKKPKPATAGEKIASGDWGLPRRKELSRRIDRAIARAVRKERERCVWCARNFGATAATVVFIKDGSKP